MEQKRQSRIPPPHYAQGDILNRSNGLYLIIGALIVAVIGLGAYVYHEKQKPEGVELTIGKNGVSVEQK